MKDWKRVQQPIFLFLAVLFFITICIYYAYAFCQQQRQASLAQNQALITARLQLQSSDAEKTTIETFLPQYEALIAQGFIGEEHRTAWIDALIDIQKSHQLFEIQYAMGQLETFNQPYLTNFSPFTLHQSSMKLNFDLLHEGDLITFIDALKAKKLSAWVLKSCEISRTTISTPFANLHASCEIDWLTLVEPDQH